MLILLFTGAAGVDVTSVAIVIGGTVAVGSPGGDGIVFDTAGVGVVNGCSLVADDVEVDGDSNNDVPGV